MEESVVEEFKRLMTSNEGNSETMNSGYIGEENTGFTDVMIKKIFLASSATKYNNHTLCVAVTDEAEIKNSTGYASIEEFFEEKCDKKESKDLPIWEDLDDYNYDLYFETDHIFYFKDTDGMVNENARNKYYVGIMGSIQVESSIEGFEWVDNENFEKAKEEYLKLSASNKRKDENKEKLLNIYTTDEEGNFVIYKLTENAKEYEYEFKKDGTEIFKQEGTEEETLTSNLVGNDLVSSTDGHIDYKIEEETFSLDENVNMALYALPVELLVNMLSFTGSPEYVENFIDYALNESEINFKVYNLITESEQYECETFKIDTDFIMEIYEMMPSGFDSGNDNMKAYKSLIFDRKYNNSAFAGSITELSDFNDINYKSNEFDVGYIKSYLKTAYDPGDNFTIDNIEVTQKKFIRKFENELKFEVSSVSTWYGDIEFDDLRIETDYSIDGNTCRKSEYEEYDLESETMVAKSDSEVTNMIMNEKIKEQIGTITDENIQKNINVVEDSSVSMFGSDLEKGYGETINTKFKYFTAKGLGLIAIKDKGTYNNNVDSGLVFSDYLYTKYKKFDVKAAKSPKKEKVQHTTEDTNLPSVELTKVNKFLSLWKNENGYKRNRRYDSNGKLVEYDDIYNGTSKVGDLFESAPEAFFNLLEASENTRDLVEIFKYIMYVYTGKDYGITDVSQIQAILQTSGTYIGSGFVISSDAANAAPVLTREQLEAVIETYSGSIRDNLRSAIDGFMYVQDTYNVNAVFAMAVAIAESSGGTNWGRISEDTYNWMSVQGSYNGESWTGSDGQAWRQYDSFDTATRDFGKLISSGAYFPSGRIDVASIGQIYCPPGNTWASSVSSIMKNIYQKANVTVEDNITGGFEDSAAGEFSVGNRVYKNYKQFNYKNVTLANDRDGDSIAKSGCAITSVAIIANGFGNSVTPVDVNNYYKTLGSSVHERGLAHYTGLTCSYQYSDVKKGIIEQLNRGLPVFVHVRSNNNTFSTSTGHFFTILSISEDGSQIYVSDPGSSRANRNGWMSISVLNGSEFDKYIKME